MNLFLVFFLTAIPFSIFSQENKKAEDNIGLTNEAKETKTKEDSEKKWYFYLQGGGGNTKLNAFNGIIGYAKLGVEYRPKPFLGIGFGISANNSNFTEKTDAATLLQTFLLSGYNLNSGINASALPIIIQAIPRTFRLNYNTANIDFNLHMNKDRPFDPYIGFGLIGGSCFGGSGCSLVGGEGRLGLQRNYTTFFFYLQGQYQALIFLPLQSSVSLTNAIGSIGIGARF